MPWSAGTYTLPRDMTDDDSAGIPILASNFDEQFEDIRDGINICLTEDGQNVPTANLPMATFRHTNVGEGAAATDYARLDQLQQGKANFGRATGEGAYVVTLSPSTTLADGMVINFFTSAMNSAADPTLAVNGASAKTITYKDSTSILANQFEAGTYQVTFNSSADEFHLTNLSPGTNTAPGIVKLTSTANQSAGGSQIAAVDSLVHGEIIEIISSVTVTGFSATNDTVNYTLTRHGKNVTLQLDTFSRNDSTAITMGLAGTFLPSGMRPLVNMSLPIVRVQDNSVQQAGLLLLNAAGTVGFNASVPGSAFTASGTKGWTAFSVTFAQGG